MPVTKIYLEDGKYKKVRFGAFSREIARYEQRKRVPDFNVYTFSSGEDGNLEVLIPVERGLKTFKYRAFVELVNPYFEPSTNYVGEDDERRVFVDYILKAEDMKVVVENNG